MEWISVQDALPELHTRVLVFSKIKLAKSIFIAKRIPHDITNPENKRWHWTRVVNNSEITHWMQLPQMPE